MVCWADRNERADTCLHETRVSVKEIVHNQTSAGGGEDGAEVMERHWGGQNYLEIGETVSPSSQHPL